MSDATADLWDERGESLDALTLQFQMMGAIGAFSGRIRTVRCLHDNALVKQMLASPGGGQVLVVDGGGSLRTALMGDLIAASAVESGWAGVIVHGAIRDRQALAALPLGVAALGSTPRKSAKLGAGEVDVAVTIDGVVFRPGAQVWVDADGIVTERVA